MRVCQYLVLTTFHTIMFGGNFDAGLGLDVSDDFSMCTVSASQVHGESLSTNFFHHRGMFRLMCLRICVLELSLFFRVCICSFAYYVIIEL